MDYSDIKAEVALYINRTDLTARIANWVNFAQRKIERVSNFIGMETWESDTLASAGYTIDIPSRYKSTIEFGMIYNSMKYPCKKTGEREILSIHTHLTNDTGRPLYFCPRESQSEIWVRPTADQEYTYYHSYYRYSADLASDDATNWITNNYPELLIYMSLTEAEPYIQNDKRMDTWNAMATTLLDRMIDVENQRFLSPNMTMYAI